jgi:hypothetical protein
MASKTSLEQLQNSNLAGSSNITAAELREVTQALINQSMSDAERSKLGGIEAGDTKDYKKALFTKGMPAAPYNLVVTKDPTSVTATVTAYPVAVDSYNWYLNGRLIASNATNSYTFTGLTPDTKIYRVACSVTVAGEESQMCHGNSKVFDTLGEGDLGLAITNRNDYGWQAYFYSGTYNRTYVVFMGDRADSPMYNYIFYYDHDTGLFSDYEIVTSSASGELHLHATMVIDDEGYIYTCVESSHNSSIKIYKSDNPEDITSFTQINTLTGSYAYPRMDFTENGRLVIIARNGFYKLTLAYSDDKGSSFTVTDLTTQFNPSDEFWMYAVSVYARKEQGIHILLNYRANDAADRGYPNLYHFYSKDGINWGDAVHFQTNGESGFMKDVSSAPITKEEADHNYAVILEEGDYSNLNHAGGATLDESGNIYITVATGNYNQTPNLDGHFIYRFNNTTWRKFDVTSLVTLTSDTRTNSEKASVNDIVSFAQDHLRIFVRDVTGSQIGTYDAGEVRVYESFDGGATWGLYNYLFKDSSYNTQSNTGVVQGNYYNAPEAIYFFTVMTDHLVSSDIYLSVMEVLTTSSGATSYSLSFDGIDDNVDTGDINDINNSSQTWECWCNLNGQSTDNIRLLDKRGAGSLGTAPGMQISFNYNGFGNTVIDAGDGNYISTAGQGYTASDLYDSSWHHVALVWDNSTGTLTGYVDAVERFSLTDANMIGKDCSNALSFVFGMANGGAQLMDGSLSDVRVWNFARSQAQIQADKDFRLTGNESGLIGYWRLDDVNTPSVATDSSAAGNDGTINGANYAPSSPF